MDDIFSYLIILIATCLFFFIITYAIKIKKTKGSFNEKAILLCVFAIIFGPIGIIAALIVIDKKSDKYTKKTKATHKIKENIVFDPNDPYLKALLDTAFDFMDEYLSSDGRMFALFVFVDYVDNSYSTDEYIKVEVILSDWYPYIIENKNVLKNFTDYFKYDVTTDKFISNKILAKMNSYETTSSVQSLIHAFAKKYETENPYIKFDRTSWGISFSKTS